MKPGSPKARASRHPPDSIHALLGQATRALEVHSDSPRLDAQILLAHILERDRGFLLAWPERRLDTAQREHFQLLVERRLRGEPVAYLIGRREFWSLELSVGPGVLIPRPETELLVERALSFLATDTPATIADLGTGSGAIALALAHERATCRVLATDASQAALDIAHANAERLNLHNIAFRLGDWYAPLQGTRLDLIVSNPPYIAEGDPHLKQGDLRHEPAAALSSGPDGLDAIRHLIDHAPAHLNPGGRLLLEHGWDQAEAVARLLKQKGFTDITNERDLAGQARLSHARIPG